ncbi:MAG: acyltransferase family protein [Usitatibacter sp.]
MDEVSGAQILTRSESRRPAYAWRADIDGLRALAVLCVVVFHAFPALVPGGFIGVDVFFVISGFLITGILLKEHDQDTFSLLRFYGRRVRRLFPALALVLVATVLAAFAFGNPGTIASTGKHGVAGALSIANITLWREAGYFDAASHLKPLLHLWSLGVEEQFYLVWPVLLAFALRGRRWVLGAGAVVCIASLLITEATNVRHGSGTFLLPFSRVWELGTGAALAILIHRGGSDTWTLRREVADLLGLAGVGAIVASALLLDVTSPFPGIRAVPAVAGTALIIWSGSRDGKPGRVIEWTLASAPVTYIGAISYSLYLWHWPLFSLPAASGVELDAMARIVLVCVAFLLAAATFRWVETPVRRSAAPQRAALFSCLALIGASALCGAVYVNERWAPRPEQRQLAQTLAWPALETGGGTCPDPVRAIDPEVAYCRVSARSEASAVVWGDSHANHYFPGLALQDPGRSWMLLANSACPPVAGIEVVAIDPDCRAHSEAILRWLEQQGHIETVVLGFFGHYQDDSDVAHGHRHFGGVGPSKVRIEGARDERTKAQGFERGLEASVQRLEAAGKRVVIVIDVPELPFDPVTCFLPPRIPLFELACSVSMPEVARRQANIRGIIARIGERHPTATVADPTPAICDPEFCGPGTRTEPIYLDSHHLSLHGSALAAKAILQAVR